MEVIRELNNNNFAGSENPAEKENIITEKESIMETTTETAMKPKKNIFTKVLLILLIVLLIVFIGFRVYDFIIERTQPEEVETPVISVKVIEADYSSISATAPLTGRISPVEEAAIVPLASGQVTAVHVKVGDYVKAGQLLFEIDKTQMATTYNQAKAAYDLAANTYNSMEKLYAEGAISKTDFDSAKVNYISAKESFTAAADAYSYCNVTSPINGYVTSLSVSVGNIAGQQMAASVADTSELKIETTVSEYLAGMIKIGDVLDVYVSTLGDTPYKGTVTAFSPAPALGTLTYPITITLDNESGDLFSGMFAEVQITSEEANDVICIPSEAVIMKNGKSVAVILDENNIPSYAEVETGIDNGEYVEILSGVNQGDTVVVSGQEFVTEGTAVNVIQ